MILAKFSFYLCFIMKLMFEIFFLFCSLKGFKIQELSLFIKEKYGEEDIPLLTNSYLCYFS